MMIRMYDYEKWEYTWEQDLTYLDFLRKLNKSKLKWNMVIRLSYFICKLARTNISKSSWSRLEWY